MKTTLILIIFSLSSLLAAAAPPVEVFVDGQFVRIKSVQLSQEKEGNSVVCSLQRNDKNKTSLQAHLLVEVYSPDHRLLESVRRDRKNIIFKRIANADNKSAQLKLPIKTRLNEIGLIYVSALDTEANQALYAKAKQAKEAQWAAKK